MPQGNADFRCADEVEVVSVGEVDAQHNVNRLLQQEPSWQRHIIQEPLT